MERKGRSSRSSTFWKCFTRSRERCDQQHSSKNPGDSGEHHRQEGEKNTTSTRAEDLDPCSSRKELRIFVGTWNVGGRSPMESLAVDLDEWLNLKDAADMYVLGLQEIVPLTTQTVIGPENSKKATDWNLLIGKALNYKYGCPCLTPTSDTLSSYPPETTLPKRRASRTENKMLISGAKYKLLASKKMVGVFVSVFVSVEIFGKYLVSDVKACSVACGFMGCLGNKGAVSVSVSIDGTSFCFIAAHLASGEKKGDEGRRNYQVMQIFRRTRFPRPSKNNGSGNPFGILDHDQVFWFGDLNYRLYSEDELARHLIQKQDWKALQKFDQLRQEQEDGVFKGWKEGDLKFPPTYKYSSSYFDRYSGGLPVGTGEKQRTPAWCDRILWCGKDVKQVSYFRSESKFSDHRPVSALFSMHVERGAQETDSRVTGNKKYASKCHSPQGGRRQLAFSNIYVETPKCTGH